ncbi:uncharacterized protein LOC111319070 isoform X2 [Stylophora pistillata]|nr:uncharacterized protein LOC111319070 isoform X2 [Stylophora pistillata]
MYYGGFVNQECHPQGSSSYGLPAPVAVDYSQGNHPAALLNPSHQGSQTLPQSQNRQPSSENDQNPYAGASSMHYSGLFYQGYHPRGHNRHSSPKHGQNPYAGASSRYYGGFRHQECYPQGSSSYGLPAPVAVDYCQGNHPAAFLNPNNQGSQTFPQSQNRKASSENDQDPYAGAGSTHHSGPFYQGYHPQGSDHCLVVEHLRDEYMRRSNVKPLMWDSEIQLPIDDVYTRLQIKWRKKACFQLTEEEVHMYEIFKPAKEGEKGARMVLVEGNPGIGKTTFCLKIARDWAKKSVPVEFHFPVFQLLFLLKCCDIHKDTKDIVQAIDEQLLNDDMKNREDFLEYIRDGENQDKILLILDGLDELPEASVNVVVKLFRRKIFSRCFILATSREEKGIDLRERYDFHTLLQIKGFTAKDAADYIRKHFKSVDPQNLSKGERLIQAVEENIYLGALRNNPLNLLLLCVVFEDFEGKLPSNRTKLYQIIFRCLLRRYCSRSGLDVHRNADKALENQFKESILVLGELAWKCLLEDRRSFSEEELDKLEYSRTHVRNFPVIKLGLIFMEASSRPSQEPRHQCHFLHKTFQEFLAAFYLKDKILMNQLNLTLGKQDVCVKFREVFYFVAGILGMDGTVFFKQIGTILRQDWDWHNPYEDCKFLLDLLEESGAADDLGKVACPLIPLPNDLKLGMREPFPLKFIRYAYEGAIDGGDLAPVQLTTLSLRNLQSFSRDNVSDFHRILESSETLTELVISNIENMSHDIADLFAESVSSSTSLRKVTLKLFDVITERCTKIVTTLLPTFSQFECVALEFFGDLNNTAAQAVKVLLKTSLKSLALIVYGNLNDCLVSSVSEGLGEETELESLSLVIYGRPSNPGIVALQKGVLRNRTLHSLELRVYGEIPETWMTAVATILAANKSWKSLIIHPNVCGKIKHEERLLHYPILGDAPSEKSLTMNVCGELSVDSFKALGGFFMKSSPLSGLHLTVQGKLSNDVVDCLVDYFLTNNSLSSHSIIDLCCEITSYGETALQRLVQGGPEHSISVLLNGVSKDRYLSGFDTLANFSPPSTSFLADGKTATYDEVIALFSCASSTTFNLTVNNHADMPWEWARGVAKGLANSRSLFTFSLTVNSQTYNLGKWALCMRMGLPKCASLTTFSLTINNHTDKVGRWAVHMRWVLPNCASLTTFSLTVNNHTDNVGNWASFVSEGLSECKSLTTFSLTVNNHNDEGANWAVYVSRRLPECASLTTFSLTVNNHTDQGVNWAVQMSRGLPKCTSLTTFSLALVNLTDKKANWAFLMSNGLPKCTSLTTFSLTVNNHTDEGANWAVHMSKGLPKCASLTTFSLTLNNHTEKRANWAFLMSKGLPKCTSLTTFSLTVDNYTDEMENWADSVSKGLANSRSLTTFSLIVNDHADMMRNWMRDISNVLEKNGSLTTIRIAFNLYGVHRIR